MRIVRQSPFREWSTVQNQMNQLLEQTWRDARPMQRAHALPLDIQETDDVYTVITDIPGMSAEQINISLDVEAIEAEYHDGVLSLSLPKAPEAKPRQITVKTNGKA